MKADVLSWWGDAGAEGAQITVNAEGALTGLHLGGSEELVSALGVWGIGAERYRPTTVRVEADEIETSGMCGGVEVRVRHNVDHVWQVRIGLSNPGDQPVRVDRLLLEAAAGADGWLEVFAAGAVAYVAVHRLDTPRCLALRLTRGDLVVGADGLGTPELELAPGGRYQLVLSGEWYAGPAAVRHRLPVWFPESLDHPAADRMDALIDHPDVAVTVQPRADAPDLELVEVGEPRGMTRLEVAYVDEDLSYGRIAQELAAGGVCSSAAEGLIVLRGLAAHQVSRAEAAGLVESYLDRPEDSPGPLRVLLLVRAVEVLGGELVDRAAVELAALPPGPGVSLAALHVLAVAPHSVALEELAGRLAGLLGDPATDPVTLAELRILLAGGAEAVRSRMVRAQREVDLLCAPGPGELWPAREDSAVARALVVRSLLPGPDHYAAPERVRRVIARATAAPYDLEALAWLTLAAEG